MPPIQKQKQLLVEYNSRISQAEKFKKKAENLEKEIENYLLQKLGIEIQKTEKKTGLQMASFRDLSRWNIDYILNADSIENFFKGKYKTVRFGDISRGISGGTPSKKVASFWKGKIPWVSPKDMKTDFITETEDYISESAIENSSTQFLEIGNIIFVMRSGILQRTVPVAINWELNPDYPVAVIVGKNGSGKTNLLEAIITIFQDLQLYDHESKTKSLPKFEFEIEYLNLDDAINIKNDETLKITKSYKVKESDENDKEIETVKTENVPLSQLQNFRQEISQGEDILPKSIFVYYAGNTTRLAELTDKSISAYKQRLEDIANNKIERQSSPKQPLFYYDLIHHRAVFLTLMLSSLKNIQDDFLKDDLGIENLASVEINISRPNWKRGSSKEILADIESFWDAPIYLKRSRRRKKTSGRKIRCQPFGNCPCRNVDFILQIVDMIYIRKTQPPESLIEYVELEKKKFVDNFSEEVCMTKYPEYDFNNQQKKDLREQLYLEQKALCCYCMKIIEIDNEDNSKNATIEHFLPDSVFKENCADYFNLYLTCPNLHKNEDEIEAISDEKHYDKFKGNYLIPKFIGYLHREKNGNVTKCEDFFQYNANGYILPSGSYKSLEDFKKNYENLGIDERAALLTIETLNLNAEVLRKERLEFIKDSIQTKIFTLNDKEELNKILEEYETAEKKEFAGVAIYFVKEKLKFSL